MTSPARLSMRIRLGGADAFVLHRVGHIVAIAAMVATVGAPALVAAI